MEDATLSCRIDALANKDHEIWNTESRGEATEADREQLRKIQVTFRERSILVSETSTFGGKP